MTFNMPYNKIKAQEDGIKELRDCEGTQFDIDLVEKFIDMLDKYKFKKMTNIGHFFLSKFIIIFINIFFIERRYNMIRVSDIMEKEIINVKNGKRMGFITDIDMDINEGKVISFSISGDSGRVFFSRGYEEESIFWNDILKIGCDTIIVNIGSELNLDEFNI